MIYIMCIAVSYVYQCYSCHSIVIKDLLHGPRYLCPLVMTTDHCPTGLVWNAQRRRCCDDIDPRAAADSDDSKGEYNYVPLRSEKLYLWCEVQYEIRQLGVHAESEVLDTTTTTTTTPTSPVPSQLTASGGNRTACGCSTSTYWGEADHRRRCHHSEEAKEEEEDVVDEDDDDDDDEEGGAPL